MPTSPIAATRAIQVSMDREIPGDGFGGLDAGADTGATVSDGWFNLEHDGPLRGLSHGAFLARYGGEGQLRRNVVALPTESTPAKTAKYGARNAVGSRYSTLLVD